MKKFIIIILTLIACKNEKSSISMISQKNSTSRLIENSTYNIPDNNKFFSLDKIYNGENLVFVYQNKDITFVDATDYEATFKELIIFEIDPSIDFFEYSDKELNETNCLYSLIIYSKILNQ